MVLALTAGVLGVVMGGLLLALVSGAFDRGPDQPAGTGTRAVTVALPEEVVSGAPSGGAGERIQVHGHWTIEVREPDGTLVTRREFDNALDGFAPGELAKIMVRVSSVGLWQIDLHDDFGGNNPCILNGLASACSIKEPPGNDTTSSFFNLTVQVPISGANLFNMVLSGSATVQIANGSIASVSTTLTTCPGNVAPADCPTDLGPGQIVLTFSGTSIAPVAVQSGQQILATVVFSFS